MEPSKPPSRADLYFWRPFPIGVNAQKEHTIHFSGLKDGTHAFAFDLQDPFFVATSDEELEGGKVHMEVRLDKHPTTLVVDLHARGAVRLRCDHCNGLMEYPIDGQQQQIFHLNGTDHFEGDEDDEVVGLAPEATEINLSHYFYECVRLALPIRRVHPEGQCDPEVERAMTEQKVVPEPEPDPRWAALNALKKK